MINDTCINCVRYEFGRTCEAFPKKIPAEIWNGDNSHRKPIKGQKNDIVFKPLPK